MSDAGPIRLASGHGQTFSDGGPVEVARMPEIVAVSVPLRIEPR